MRVVITGGSGFIGTNLTRWFADHEPDTEVVVLDTAVPQIALPPSARYVYGDIRDVRCLVEAFRGADEVYNLAGILGTSELIPLTRLAVEVNVGGAASVFDACVLAGVPRVYNVAKPSFESLHENAYTLTKHGGELLGQLYREKFGLEVATIRWLNAVGPYQHLYPVRKFVPTMILFALHDVDLEIYGSGAQTIDAIDTRDMCRYTVYACRNLGRDGRVHDLGSGVAISCNDAARLILGMVRYRFDTKSKLVHVPMRAGEADDVQLVADMSFWEGLGMQPQYGFEESIADCIGYIAHLPQHYQANALRFYGKEARR